MISLQQMKAMERLREKLRGEREQAEAEAHMKMKSAPRVPKELQELIEGMLNKIRSYNDYTFEYEAAVRSVEADYKKRNERRPLTIWINPGNYSISHYEHANHEALKLKKDITRLLAKYKTFNQKFPDFRTLDSNGINKEFHYQNVDPYVLKTEKLLKELRCFGEKEVDELKQTGVNMAYLLGVSEKELNG